MLAEYLTAAKDSGVYPAGVITAFGKCIIEKKGKKYSATY